MTEQDFRAKLTQCDKEIVSAYSNYLSAARSLGNDTYRAATKVRSEEESSASRSVALSILVPLGLSALGLFIVSSNGFLGFLCIVGGIALAISLGKKSSAKKEAVEASMKHMENSVKNLQEQLIKTIDGNSII